MAVVLGGLPPVGWRIGAGSAHLDLALVDEDKAGSIRNRLLLATIAWRSRRWFLGPGASGVVNGVG